MLLREGAVAADVDGHGQHDELGEDRDAQIKGHVEFDDMMAHSQHANLLEYQKEQLLNQLAQAQIVIEEKRKVLTECMKKTLALEKLKEKELNDYKKALSREENNFLDELGSQGYFRKTFN